MQQYTKQTTNSNTINCPCGKTCNRSQSFSVYDGRFCSMDCLIPYKKAMDLKKKPVKLTEKVFNDRSDFGGPACF